MAPPKTMVASCQQNQPGLIQKEILGTQQNVVKPRKRNKSKQQVNSSQADKVTENQQTVEVKSQLKQNKADNNPEVSRVVPSERITIKKLQQLQNKVPSPTKPCETNIESIKRAVNVDKGSVIAKQVSTDETDEIDAGIELDGSSYSGSSVKDICEDQLKSASVSPVMAQTSLVNETSTKLAADVTSVEQIAGTICAVPLRKASATKQELAAIQQVIEADEQQLQQKLLERHLKLQDSNKLESLDSATVNARSTLIEGDRIVPNDITEPLCQDKNILEDRAAKSRRRFSTQSSLENQDVSMCKVCSQHVYQMERMMAEKSLYHKRCFRCFQCKIQLRVDNYSSHEGQVYCKAHHRQIFQPQVKLDDDEDVDIVAKSNRQLIDDYLLHRGRLSELSFSFLQQDSEEILKRQMIICENEPAELPKDVIRSETKKDDDFQQLNLNLNNILEKFERGTASGEESQPSSASTMIDKPSFNIRKTLMAFESKLGSDGESAVENKSTMDRPVVKKLGNLENFFKISREEDDEVKIASVKPLVVRRSESLMNRLKKYESRIAGELVDDDEDDNGDEKATEGDISKGSSCMDNKKKHTSFQAGKSINEPKQVVFPKRINLSSLKSQWENGDISTKRDDCVEDDTDYRSPRSADVNGESLYNGASLMIEKQEELNLIRQQLARRKSGEKSSIRNIYEDAIKEAQQQRLASKRNSNDLSALDGLSTSSIQRQLLQNDTGKQDANLLTKEQFQLNLSNRANKLKEKFELGLINNHSHDDSEQSENEESPAMSKMDQLRQEKLEDLSIFTEGEIKAREARSMFQQIDRSLSSSQIKPAAASRSSLPTRVRSSIDDQTKSQTSPTVINNHNPQPIRLTNNVRT